MRPALRLGADCATAQRFVLRNIGGRAYRSHVDPVLRLLMMRDRTRRLTRKSTNDAAVMAAAVSGYLESIGDAPASSLWNELAQDLTVCAEEKSVFPPKIKFAPWELGLLPSNWQALGRYLAGGSGRVA